jgi:hypothetical protein
VQQTIQGLLDGAVETHAHGSPDVIPRKLKDSELVQEALEAKMEAIVLKCHHTLTSDRASLLETCYPDIKVLGGIPLNNTATGGFNPAAVDAALKMDARIIWMPTVSALNTKVVKGLPLKKSAEEKVFDSPLSVLNDNGKILSSVITIMELIAENDAVLATGHLSVTETKRLLKEAVRTGITRILINHPQSYLIKMSIDDQRELLRYGVFFERCYVSHIFGLPFEEIVDAIKRVGPQSTILATDLGQVDNPSPVDGLGMFLDKLLQSGIPEKDLEVMVKKNPKQLLGI